MTPKQTQFVFSEAITQIAQFFFQNVIRQFDNRERSTLHFWNETVLGIAIARFDM